MPSPPLGVESSGGAIERGRPHGHELPLAPPAPWGNSRGSSPAPPPDIGPALPRWYAGLCADLEASFRTALEANDAETRRRADRQENQLAQLLARLDEMKTVPDRESRRPSKAPDCRLHQASDVAGVELRPNEAPSTKLGSLKSQESSDTLVPEPECNDEVGGSAWGSQLGRNSAAAEKAAEGDIAAQDIPLNKIVPSSAGDGSGSQPFGAVKSLAAVLESPLTRLVESHAFNSSCTFVIFLNTIYMGVISDLLVKVAFDNVGSGEGDANLDSVAASFEAAFLSFYVLELILKAFALKASFIHGPDGWWNMFDCVIVAVGLMGTVDIGYDFVWLRIVRAIVKFAKALRVFRLVQFFKELRVIMLAIAYSLRTFCWAMACIGIMMYICAIVFVQGVAEFIGNTSMDEVPESVLEGCFDNWGSMHKAMVTEYKAISGGGPWGGLMDALYHTGPFYYYFFLLYIGIMVLAVFKIITGIFVQKAKAAADKDHERSIEQNMMGIFEKIDLDKSGSISKEEFKACIESDVATDYWRMLHIKPSDARKLFALMDSSGDGNVDIGEFINGCKKFSGWARNIDMAVAISRIHEQQMYLHEFMYYVEDCFDAHFGHHGPLPMESPNRLGERIDRIKKVKTSRVMFDLSAQVEANKRDTSIVVPETLRPA